MNKKANKLLTIIGAGLVGALSLSDSYTPHKKTDNFVENNVPAYSGNKQNSYNLNMFEKSMPSSDNQTLDSLIDRARTLNPDLVVPRVYEGTKLDSLEKQLLNYAIFDALTREVTPNEIMVNSILDTVSNYSNLVDKYFIKASIKQESNYNPRAISKVGAKGLMQFMKPAWKMFGEGSYLSNVYNPEKNIRAGIKYYLWMEDMFSKKHPKWDVLSSEEKRGLLSVAYNGGPYGLMGKKINWNVEKMPKESQNHAIKVNEFVKEFQMADTYRQIFAYKMKIDMDKERRQQNLYASVLPNYSNNSKSL